MSGKGRRERLTLFLLGFLLYANGIPNHYALDDGLVITSNDFTREGLGGVADILTSDAFRGHFGDETPVVAGGRYRPLSIVTFALEWSLFGVERGDEIDFVATGGSPHRAEVTGFDAQGLLLRYAAGDGGWRPARVDLERYLVASTVLPYVSHAINALLYGLTGVLLYLWLAWCLPAKDGRPWWLQLAFVATALYLVHPLHVEVVANIKGRDDILGLLLMLAAAVQFARHYDTGSKRRLVMAVALVFLSLLGKESGLPFLLVLPLALYFFKNERLARSFARTLPLWAGFALYLVMRFVVAGLPLPLSPPTGAGGAAAEITEIMNDPFYGTSRSDALATVLYTWGRYMKLLVFPHPLTHDYYPFQIPIVGWSDLRVLASLLLHALLVLVAVLGFRSRSLLSFSILFYFLTFSIVSNLVFSIGTFMNERFLYWPSIGFCLALAWLLTRLVERISESEDRFHVRAAGVFGLILVAFSVKTVTRTPVWRDDLALFTTDVEVSRNSAKAHMSAGLALVEESRFEEDASVQREMLDRAIEHLERSTELYPAYTQAWVILGNAFLESGDFARAIDGYETCLELASGQQDALRNLSLVAARAKRAGRYPDAARALELAIRFQPGEAQHYKDLGRLLGTELGDPTRAVARLAQADALSPGDADVLQMLGVLTGMLGRFEESLGWLQKALERRPDDAGILRNLGATYLNLGDSATGQRFIDRAKALDPGAGR